MWQYSLETHFFLGIYDITIKTRTFFKKNSRDCIRIFDVSYQMSTSWSSLNSSCRKSWWWSMAQSMLFIYLFVFMLITVNCFLLFTDVNLLSGWIPPNTVLINDGHRCVPRVHEINVLHQCVPPMCQLVFAIRVCRHCTVPIICICLRIVASNSYCVNFLFCFSSSCVPYSRYSLPTSLATIYCVYSWITLMAHIDGHHLLRVFVNHMDTPH
jgi:hypothetical protein